MEHFVAIVYDWKTTNVTKNSIRDIAEVLHMLLDVLYSKAMDLPQSDVIQWIYSALVIKILSNICEDVHLLVKLQTYRDMQIFNMAEAHTCTRLFFYKQRFFSTQRQCCLTFSWIKPQTLLSCCFSYKHHHTEKLFQSRFKSRLFGLHVSFAFLRK